MSNRSKDVGTAWERRVADHAAAAGLPWDRAPLRGSNDLLDIVGCLPYGLLVGCKALTRKGNLADRMSAAMDQNAVRAAMGDADVAEVDGQPVFRRQFTKVEGYTVAPYERDTIKRIKGGNGE